MSIRNAVLGCLGGAIGVVAAIWLGYVISDVRAQAKTVHTSGEQVSDSNNSSGSSHGMPSGASGNFSINQQGGVANQTYINQAQERLKLTATLRAELLATVLKDKPLVIVAVGSPSDIIVGRQISDFLKENGYEVELTTTAMLVPVPDHPITWNSATSTLVVAPSVR